MQVHLLLEAPIFEPNCPFGHAHTIFKVPLALITHHDIFLLASHIFHRLIPLKPTIVRASYKFLETS